MKPSDRIFLFSKTPFDGVMHIPIIQTHSIKTPIDFTSVDYMIITSKEAVLALDDVLWKSVPVIAISQATAEFILAQGGIVEAIGTGDGQSLSEMILDAYKDKKMLYLHAEKTAFDMQEALDTGGVKVSSEVVYKTECNTEVEAVLPDDAICIFTSPSSVECFMKKFEFLPTHRVVCIGQTTAKALPQELEYTLAPKHSVESSVMQALSLLK
jgi:uroporphyrinogen-III synthase